MYHKKISPLSFVLSLLTIASAIFYAPATANAGFQWVAPSASSTESDVVIMPDAQSSVAPYQSNAATKPQSLSPSASSRGADIISPLVIDGSSAAENRSAAAPQSQTYLSAPAAAPVVSSAPSSVPTTVLAPPPSAATSPSKALAPEPILQSSESSPLLSAPTDSSSPKSGEKVVSGFANKVPLAVALRQLLPSDYGFSVDNDVSLSTQVSWRGGRAWKEVMTDMLQDAGLGMKENGQMIRITRSGSAAPSTSAAPILSSSPAPALQPLASKNVPEHVLKLPSGMTSESAGSLSSPSPSLAAPSSLPEVQAAAPVRTTETWSAGRGDMLRKVLEAWAKRAGVEFNWTAEYDYPLQASISITGSFEDAVRNLLSGFQEAQPQPVARLHNNPTAGQTVLVVESRGNNYGN